MNYKIKKDIIDRLSFFIFKISPFFFITSLAWAGNLDLKCKKSLKRQVLPETRLHPQEKLKQNHFSRVGADTFIEEGEKEDKLFLNQKNDSYFPVKILFQSLYQKTGLNQRQLAKKLGICYPSIIRCVTGKNRLGEKIVKKLHEHFHILYDLSAQTYMYLDPSQGSFEEDCRLSDAYEKEKSVKNKIYPAPRILFQSLLKKTGFNQVKLGIKIGITENAISQILLKKGNIGPKIAQQLKEHFHVLYDIKKQQYTYLDPSNGSFEEDCILAQEGVSKAKIKEISDNACILIQSLLHKTDLNQEALAETLGIKSTYIYQILLKQSNIGSKLAAALYEHFGIEYDTKKQQYTYLDPSEGNFEEDCLIAKKSVPKIKRYQESDTPRILFQSLFYKTGLNQKELAKKLEISEGCIHQLLLKKTNIGLKVAGQLKKHFHVLYDINKHTYKYAFPSEESFEKDCIFALDFQKKEIPEKKVHLIPPFLIKVLLKKTGMTKTQLARQLGIQLCSINHILWRGKGIGPKIAAALKEHFQILYDITEQKYTYLDPSEQSFEEDCLLIQEEKM